MNDIRAGRTPSRHGTGPDGKPEAMPWLVLAGALALTLATTAFVGISVRERDRAAFQHVVQTTNDNMAARLEIYVATLRGTAGLFASANTVTAEAFHAYVSRLDLPRWYPGIQGIGWTARLAHLPDEAVDERHSIIYLEPMDERNRTAIGYDMYGEPVRREAMRRARDNGVPAMSGRVRLVQEIEGPLQAGFLIYLPVYEGGGVPATVAERRERLLGFVYSPFRADDLFAGIFGTAQEARVTFSVYAADTEDSAALLHTSPATPGHRPRMTGRSRVDILGRPWTVVYATEPVFEAGTARYLVPLALTAGLLASGWLFRLARGQTRARLAAERANRAKSQFLAMMSHELRTPLNAISGYTELMEIGVAGEVTPLQKDYLDRIQRAQRHLLGLITDILNFAKVDAGRATFTMTAMRVAAAVEEADRLMSAQAEAAGLRYRSDGGPPVQVWADPDRVRQILLNLLSNAVKFTAAGGQVRTSWVAGGRQVHIRVDDTGPGIAADQQERIFDPFVQADADLTRVQQGTGLGLTISRELARAMGGDIRLESAPGRGSRFILVLPEAVEGTQPRERVGATAGEFPGETA